METNYSAWDIRPENFPARKSLQSQLEFILGFGILAPSGHNGQPWRFSIYGAQVSVYVVKERALSHSDPQGRQLCLGVGCLVENIKVAADYFGFSVTSNYVGDISGKQPIVVLLFQKQGDQKNDMTHSVHAISKRHTNRNKYSMTQTLPQDFVAAVTGLADQHAEIFLTQGQAYNHELADIVVQAQIKIMNDPEFRRELSHLMKANSTASNVGMPGFAFGLPTPISWLSSLMIRYLNMSKVNEAVDRELFFKATPGFLVICGSDDQPAVWFRAGEMLEKIWLLASQKGISLSVNAAPIQDTDFRKQLAQVLGSQQWPLIFSRIGFAVTPARPVPRLTVAQALTQPHV